MNLKIDRVIKNWKYAKDIQVEDSNFISNGFGRQFKKQKSQKLWNEAFKEFNLIPAYIEPTYGNFVGNHYKDGACVQVHKDSAPEGYVHTRCNLMLRKPAIGGNPVLDNKEIVVEENDLWLCLASLEYHSSTAIKNGERFIYSFGGLVPFEQIKKIILNENILQ
jgi:hypothetical protein